jgi:hypothetical protein
VCVWMSWLTGGTNKYDVQPLSMQAWMHLTPCAALYWVWQGHVNYNGLPTIDMGER